MASANETAAKDQDHASRARASIEHRGRIAFIAICVIVLGALVVWL
jgi:hypothetical protein